MSNNKSTAHIPTRTVAGSDGFVFGHVVQPGDGLADPGNQPGFRCESGAAGVVDSVGAVMAAKFGVLLGALVKNIDTLFATIKGLGFLLYAPALVYMFPEIPQWIGRIFPTCYMIAPIIEVSQRGVAWSDLVQEPGAIGLA